MKSISAHSVETERQRLSGVMNERKWLVWLLDIWEQNDRKPTWFLIKRNWPEEYALILTEVGPWDTVERKLEVAREIQSRTEEETRLTELQKSRALGPRRKYTLEEHITGLIRLMEHLKLERLPMMKEIGEYARALGIPHKTSYERQLVTKENWGPCIRKYQTATPEERAEVLREMEVELAEQRQERWERDGMFREKNTQRGEYSREKCLEDLAKIHEHFGRIPKRVEMDQFAKETGVACYGTLLRHLGSMQGWSAQLAEYLAEREIETYVETCGNLKLRGPQAVDSLIGRALKAATASEKMIWEKVRGQLRRATRKLPATFTCELEGRDYEIIIRPKR